MSRSGALFLSILKKVYTTFVQMPTSYYKKRRKKKKFNERTFTTSTLLLTACGFVKGLHDGWSHYSHSMLSSSFIQFKVYYRMWSELKGFGRNFNETFEMSNKVIVMAYHHNIKLTSGYFCRMKHLLQMTHSRTVRKFLGPFEKKKKRPVKPA